MLTFGSEKHPCPLLLSMLASLLLLSALANAPVVHGGGDSLAAEKTMPVMPQQESAQNTLMPSDLQLLAAHTPVNRYPAKKKPTFLLVGKKKWIRYNPVNLTFGGMLFVYQSVISSQIAADCPYEISCSAFSKQSILEFGLIKGLPLSADRLTRCTRMALKDLHPLRISDKGLLIDAPSFYRIKHAH